MSPTDAQGHPESESATKFSPDQAWPLSSQTLPTPHPYLAPPPPPHLQPQQQTSALPDMTSFSAVPRMDDQAENLLPAFHTRPYTHLPTPQSPNNFIRYGDHPKSPRSPLPTIPQSPHTSPTSSSYQKLVAQNKSTDDTPTKGQSSKQCVTPESSPSYLSRTTSPLRIGFTATPSTRNNSDDLRALTPKNVQSSSALDLLGLAPSPLISSPLSAVSDQSRFSSPFIAKLSMAEKNAKRNQTLSAPTSPIPMDVDDVFSSSPIVRTRLINRDMMKASTPPISPSQTSIPNAIAPGGEIDRIRQALIEERLAQMREAETRRPDYLKRSKRQVSEIDSTIFADEIERERSSAVGITESPNKGRRIKLFQETSEESFEESLMAGGYGRYRTNDWVRQPQPLSFLSSNVGGAPNVAEMLVEHVEEAPPTERELKKRKRLEAFGSGREARPKLIPVDILGKGRVLLELPGEDKVAVVEISDSSPSKKRKRKRKSTDLTPNKDQSSNPSNLGGPNWPDDEFPWRVRKEERNEAEKALEDKRLRWIEKFLDRDTDDEDDNASSPKIVGVSHDDAPPMKRECVHERGTDKPRPAKKCMGRGKMVPLLAYPEDPRRAYANRKRVLPSDPADARAALLAKRSVRALAYRTQRKHREVAHEGDEGNVVICICNGKDDGRELVQCDDCQTWYHLQCIGIRNIAELGREEDAWFCRSCVMRLRSPSPERATLPIVLQEPTFVPTDDAPRVRRTQDPTLYHALHNSPLWNPPRMPKTPTRGGRHSDFDISSSSDSSRLPSTPQHTYDVRLYNTPGPLEYRPSNSSDDLSFDPNSTPSRGIKFGAFPTPKSNPWSIRTGGLFHTPSRHHSRGSFGRSFGSLDEIGGSFGAFDGLTRYPSVEESPIGHSTGKDAPRMKKIPESPLLARPLAPLRPALDESPIVRLQPQRNAPRFPSIAGPPSREDGAYMR